MDVILRGSSPCATVCAILLITRARQLGMRLRASIIGDETDIAPVKGPAVAHSAVLASCGIGRELGSGAVVVVPGAPGDPLMLSLAPDGRDGWFLADRDGRGAHSATEAYVRLTRDARPAARRIAKDLRRALEALGMAPEPAVLDILFGAPIAPLSRLSLALRAGRAISGTRGEAVTRYLSGVDAQREPLSPWLDREAFGAELASGLPWLLDGVSSTVHDRVEEWFHTASALAAEDAGRDMPLYYALAELASHLVQLPAHSILAPLPAHEDAIATALKVAHTAVGDDDANAQLQAMYRFLGGKYVTDAANSFAVEVVPPPDDRLARWRWFCDEAVRGRAWADEIWPNLVDPPQ